MRQLALAAGFLALFCVAFTDSSAQDKDAKGSDKKDEKKDASDADKAKKSEPKREAEEKVVWGEVRSGKIRKLDAESARDLTVGIPEPDPVKIARLQQWQTSEMARISRIPLNEGARRVNENNRYLLELNRKKETETTTPRDYDFRAADNCKVRTANPEPRYDDRGQLKPYTQRELTALKGKSKLPGYPAEFDQLKVGQAVDVYLAKLKPGAKKAPPSKDSKDDNKREVVMIVITQEAPK